MDSGMTEQTSDPADPAVDEIEGAGTSASGDTEGHSMVTLDLARVIASERVQEGVRMSRDAARVREARTDQEARGRGGLLRRLGRR